MKVKVLKEHENAYGTPYKKEKGAEYDVPDAMGETLIKLGFVEEVKTEEAEAPATDDKPAKGKASGGGKD